MLCQIYLPKTIRQCGQLSSPPLGSLTHLWWAVYQYDHPQIEKNSSKNEMLIFGLHSTSDDRPSNLSNEKCLKCGIMATKSSKNEMLVFGLHSPSDDWPSDLSDKSWLKCKKRPLKSSKNEMVIFGLCSISDDQPSNLSDESWSKWEKIGLKNKMTFWFWEILLHVDHSVLWLHRNWCTHADG